MPQPVSPIPPSAPVDGPSAAGALEGGAASRELKRVALCFPLRYGPWPAIVRGACRYARPARPWVVSLHPEDDPRPALDTRPDGVIAMVRTPAAAEAFRAWGGPLVDTTFDVPDVPFVRVGADFFAVGVRAAEYLLGFAGRAYGYVGCYGTQFGRIVGEGFVSRLRQAGHPCRVAPPGAFDRAYASDPRADRAAVEWLTSLGGPAAVFAAHDILGWRLSEACRGAGLRVPADVALLGFLDDDFLCQTASPPLASVRIPGEAIGHEAARVLDALMAGGPPPPARIEFAPLGVTARASADVTAVADPDLAAALRFIRDRAADRIGVAEVVAASGVSRSTLERRFRTALGRSPLQELARVRVERACALLAGTDLPLADVARQAGFRDPAHLTTAVRTATGVTPSVYRTRNRPTASG